MNITHKPKSAEDLNSMLDLCPHFMPCKSCLDKINQIQSDAWNAAVRTCIEALKSKPTLSAGVMTVTIAAYIDALDHAEILKNG